ncbi:MAG: PqqD family protein [Candidatus Riflebacteria bacterium]|nr:PqqD family protein [Candidatus Riflebacteria bacterium]
MSIELINRVVRKENMISSPVGNELVILNLGKDNYIGLDEIGRWIWDFLSEPCLVNELCNRLSKEFDATVDEITADVLPFLEELRQEELICVLD